MRRIFGLVGDVVLLSSKTPIHPIPSVKFLHILCHANQGSPKNPLVLGGSSCFLHWFLIFPSETSPKMGSSTTKSCLKRSPKRFCLEEPSSTMPSWFTEHPDSPTPNLGPSDRAFRRSLFNLPPKPSKKEGVHPQKTAFKVAGTCFSWFGTL